MYLRFAFATFKDVSTDDLRQLGFSEVVFPGLLHHFREKPNCSSLDQGGHLEMPCTINSPL